MHLPAHTTKAFRRTLVTAAVTLAVSHTALASSHREAPGITAMPKVDGTDFYAFNSYESGRENYVTLIANYLPLQDAYGGPNYFALDDTALYEIHVDNDGDAVEDLTFQFRFTNSTPGATVMVDGQAVAVPLKAIGPLAGEGAAAANGNFAETYTLDVVSGDRRTGTRASATAMGMGGETSFAKPIDYVGEKALGDEATYTGYIASLTNSDGIYHDVEISSCPEGASDARVFVGQRKDPFAISLGRVFDLVNLNPLGELDGNEDDLADKNVTTLALEVHKDCLTGDAGDPVIGAWTTASKRQVSVLDPMPPQGVGDTGVEAGAWTQVSRLGSPLVNEVVIGLVDKDRFNASEPSGDAQFATYVTNPTLPVLIDALFGAGFPDIDNLAPSNYPRTDLIAAFLTGFPGVNQPAVAEGEMAVTAEMLRLNTDIAAVSAEEQMNLGVAAGDVAGFPNGRRPGDDVVDVALRVVMGALCHPLPLSEGGEQLPYCMPEQAPIGTAPLTDGVVQDASMFDSAFPYLTTPIPGATIASGDDGES